MISTPFGLEPWTKYLHRQFSYQFCNKEDDLIRSIWNWFQLTDYRKIWYNEDDIWFTYNRHKRSRTRHLNCIVDEYALKLAYEIYRCLCITNVFKSDHKNYRQWSKIIRRPGSYSLLIQSAFRKARMYAPIDESSHNIILRGWISLDPVSITLSFLRAMIPLGQKALKERETSSHL